MNRIIIFKPITIMHLALGFIILLLSCNNTDQKTKKIDVPDIDSSLIPEQKTIIRKDCIIDDDEVYNLINRLILDLDYGETKINYSDIILTDIFYDPMDFDDYLMSVSDAYRQINNSNEFDLTRLDSISFIQYAKSIEGCNLNYKLIKSRVIPYDSIKELKNVGEIMRKYNCSILYIYPPLINNQRDKALTIHFYLGSVWHQKIWYYKKLKGKWKFEAQLMHFIF